MTMLKEFDFKSALATDESELFMHLGLWLWLEGEWGQLDCVHK